MIIMGIAGIMIFLFNSPGKNIFLNIGLGLWDSYNMATGLLGDVLSYVRLFALGLSGGILAGVFNSLAVGMSPDNVIAGPIVMVLIFFQPVLKAGGLEQKMAQTLDRLTLEEEAAAMENVQIRAESFEKQYYVGAWEKETERQIRMYLSESGIPGAAVSVTLEPGNTGEAKEIRIEAPMRQTSIYREEQKKQREMLDEKLTEIKSVLSEVYGTDPVHIMIEISE